MSYINFRHRIYSCKKQNKTAIPNLAFYRGAMRNTLKSKIQINLS